MDLLARIKRCALLRQVRFTEKAEIERLLDDLTELEVYESLVNATRIEKTLRSVSPYRRSRREYPHIIVSPTARGQIVYSKGKLVNDKGIETYYLLVSAKQAD
jgi:hypothetical protein